MTIPAPKTLAGEPAHRNVAATPGTHPVGQLPPVHIGLLWHSARSGNLGVGALTVANLAIVAQACREVGLEPRFTLFSMRDGDCPSVVGPDVAIATMTMRYLVSPRGYAAALASVDCMIDIGAGDSFTDIYSAKRFFMIWYSKLVTVRADVPLIMAPQTIGPFTRSPYRQLAGWIMNRATAVVARDEQSLAVARTLAPHSVTHLAADVAFSLPFDDRSEQRRSGATGDRDQASGGATSDRDQASGGATGDRARAGDGTGDRALIGGGGDRRLRVGINISGLLFAQAMSGDNRFGLSMDYAAFARQMIAQLLARGDIEVLLVTHAISGADASDDDDAIADQLAAEFTDCVRVPNFDHPSKAKSFISSLDFLIASRMHACIAAYSSGVPVIPVAYSRKFDGVFGLLGYRHSIPVTGIAIDDALRTINDAIDRRDAMAAEIAVGMTRVDALLDTYRAVLRATLLRFVPQARPAMVPSAP